MESPNEEYDELAPSSFESSSSFTYQWASNPLGNKHVISILGPIGSGKTTIAETIYRILVSENIRCEFIGELMLEDLLGETYTNSKNTQVNRVLLDTTLLPMRIRLMFNVLAELDRGDYDVAIIERPFFEMPAFNRSLQGICGETSGIVNTIMEAQNIKHTVIWLEAGQDVCFQRAYQRDYDQIEAGTFDQDSYQTSLNSTFREYYAMRSSILARHKNISAINTEMDENLIVEKLTEILRNTLN